MRSGKKLICESVLKVRVRVRQVVVRVRISLQEMKVSLCKVPTIDLSLLRHHLQVKKMFMHMCFSAFLSLLSIFVN